MRNLVFTCSIKANHVVFVVFIAIGSFFLVAVNNKLNSNLDQYEQLLAEESSKHQWLKSLRTDLSVKEAQLNSIEQAVSNEKKQNELISLETDRLLKEIQHEVNYEN